MVIFVDTKQKICSEKVLEGPPQIVHTCLTIDQNILEILFKYSTLYKNNFHFLNKQKNQFPKILGKLFKLAGFCIFYNWLK